MNIYEAMMGAPPSTQEQTEVLAQRLRNKNLMGQIGVMSGDKYMGQVGQGMMTNAQDQAKNVGLNRAKEAQRKMTQGYYDSQTASAEEKSRLAAEKFAWEKSQAGLDRAHELEMQKLKNVGKKTHRPMGFAVAKRAEEAANDMSNMNQSINAFKSEYAETSGGIPYKGSVENWISANAPVASTKAMRDQQEWWAGWDFAFNLPKRNAMFGATLTDAEKQAWAAANINPNMLPGQIKNRLNTIQKIFQSATARMQNRMSMSGYDPEEVSSIFGGIDLGNSVSGGYPSLSDGQSSPTPELARPPGMNDADWERYQKLQKELAE